MSHGTKSLGLERRRHSRHSINVDVNYRHEDHYLFSHATNLSELGIFLAAEDPLDKGTQLNLSFTSPESRETIEVAGEVMWVELGSEGRTPGMGIRFIEPTPQVRERVKALIRTIAYLG